MEKIKVNMSPNPLDVQTIHASQNDGEARQWEFELHNNGELIDTSDVKEQLVFKAYKGGTEQILPENTSTPTTSPFKGDIKYPQGLLTDQEFTYRQSPTESDGLAKITDIKGNTLVWNQLTQEINSRYFTQNAGNIVYANNSCTVTATTTSPNLGIYQLRDYRATVANHKYLISANVKRSSSGIVRVGFGSYSATVGTSETIVNNIETCPADTSALFVYGANMQSGETITIKNLMCFDLTQMFGSGNEPSTVEEFTSLFNLPYYAYNQGSLLSFMGEQIKTTGKNLFNQKWESGSIDNTTGEPIANAYIDRFKEYITVFPNTRYYYWYENIGNNMPIYYYDGNKNYLGRIVAYSGNVFETPSNCCFIRGAIANGQGLPKTLIQKDGTEIEYEPYISSTLSLPISTYFPTGMKSAGNVYDELTPRKAITRIGAVDLGNLEYVYDSTVPRFYTSGLANIIKKPSTSDIKGNAISDMYEILTTNQFFASTKDKSMMIATNGNISFINTTYSSASAFKSAMSGVYLYYELATETETSFTTASLVTENAEIPLSNEDGVLIGKCTEELSAEPGFHDAKIKLSDSDGECYSNKIQLHVERSPQ